MRDDRQRLVGLVRDVRTAPYARDRALVDKIDNDIEKALKQPDRGGPKPPTVDKWVSETAYAPLSPAPAERFRPDNSIREESIALRRGRPVLGITEGAAVLKFTDPESEVWGDRLRKSAKVLKQAIPSVGRIELDNFIAMPALATGWMIQPGIVVTNSHVAAYFAERGPQGFRFMTGDDPRRPIGVAIDFLEEVGSVAESEFTISDILFVGGPRELDVALLRVAPASGTALPPPLVIDPADPLGKTVAVIGYPLRDTRIPDQALMDSIFGDVYGRKRIAPGFVKSLIGAELSHDCTTLGGNSGSPVIDIETGLVVGLHKSGVFLKSNGAVAGGSLGDLVTKALKPPVVALSTVNRETTPQIVQMSKGSERPMSGTEISVTIPITVTVRIGDQTTTTIAATSGARPVRGNPATWAEVESAIPAAEQLLCSRPDVVAVYPGLRVTGGIMTDEPVIVVAVTQRLTPEELALKGMTLIPAEIDGISTDVTFASIADQLGIVEDWVTNEAGWVSRYQPRPELPLDPVPDVAAVTLSVSPDCGWPVLKEFLHGVGTRLTVGMYDFTAPHILKAVLDTTKKSPRELNLVLQAGEDTGSGSKKNDGTDIQTRDSLAAELKKRFDFSWASIARPFGRIGNPNGIFDSAYHIKVAVKDHASFWLSSGNWQSSNQPPLGEDGTDFGTPTKLIGGFNREWHAVVENDQLAELYENHILLDLKQAKETENVEAAGEEPYVWVPVEYFTDPFDALEAPYVLRSSKRIEGPLEIHPLLTPDNYAEVVAELIEGAQSRILFQNQSLKLADRDGDAPHFRRLVDGLLAKQQTGLDVRIIFRRIGDDLRKTLTKLKKKGFDFNKLKLSSRCHTKGIIIDRKAVVLGSHNWTNAGTKFNRDASLVIYHSDAVRYFEDLFEEDWRRSSEPSIDESLPSPRLVSPTDTEAPPRMIRVPLRDWVAL